MTSKVDFFINLDYSFTTLLTIKKSKTLNSLIHEFTRVRKNYELKKDEKGNKLLYYVNYYYLTLVIINLRRYL